MASKDTASQTAEVSLNADQAELQKFAELAHKWWDVNSEFKPLHEINPLRLNWINDLVDLKGKRVLDVGCGGGILFPLIFIFLLIYKIYI